MQKSMLVAVSLVFLSHATFTGSVGLSFRF